MTNGQARTGVTILRAAVASVFVIHGVTRTVLGTVDDFGAFLSSSGVPAGPLNRLDNHGSGDVRRPRLRPWAGRASPRTVVRPPDRGRHRDGAREGWFVVGAGRNGAEYSVLILACLFVAALTDSIAYKAWSFMSGSPDAGGAIQERSR
jgi:putative oxidoreductase